MRTDVYERITNQIVHELEQGVRPWMKPWSAEHADGRIVRPLRFNGLPYNGNQCPDVVVGGDGERLRRADMDDLQTSARIQCPCAQG